MIDEPYLIWSYEHDAWWKAERRGYTRVLIDAGVYSKAEAEAIVKDANIVAVEEEAVSLYAVPTFQPGLTVMHAEVDLFVRQTVLPTLLNRFTTAQKV
jgi:hypothetical protein